MPNGPRRGDARAAPPLQDAVLPPLRGAAISLLLAVLMLSGLVGGYFLFLGVVDYGVRLTGNPVAFWAAGFAAVGALIGLLLGMLLASTAIPSNIPRRGFMQALGVTVPAAVGATLLLFVVSELVTGKGTQLLDKLVLCTAAVLTTLAAPSLAALSAQRMPPHPLVAAVSLTGAASPLFVEAAGLATNLPDARDVILNYDRYLLVFLLGVVGLLVPLVTAAALLLPHRNR